MTKGVPVWLAAVFVVGEGGLQPSAAQTAAPVAVANDREWKSLRAHARTRAEFIALADYCDRKAVENQRKAHECEEDLRLVLLHPNTYGRAPKWPLRDQTLRQLLAKYQAEQAKWKALGEDYRRRSTGVE